MFINHKRCPDCGYRLKRNDWRCRECENQSLTDWSFTLPMWAIGLLIIGITATFMIDNLCGAEILHPFMNNLGIQC